MGEKARISTTTPRCTAWRHDVPQGAFPLMQRQIFTESAEPDNGMKISLLAVSGRRDVALIYRAKEINRQHQVQVILLIENEKFFLTHTCRSCGKMVGAEARISLKYRAVKNDHHQPRIPRQPAGPVYQIAWWWRCAQQVDGRKSRASSF